MYLCGIIVPRRRQWALEIGDQQGDCILPRGHFSLHVFKTREGRYWAWEDDVECGCCGPETDEPCYVYEEITEEKYLKILKEAV